MLVPGAALDVQHRALPPMGMPAAHLCWLFQLELALITQHWSSYFERKLLGC